jgi:hypothetical protein
MSTYTCNDYRSEMILLGLNQRLEDDALSPEERIEIQRQIKELETAMGLD